jgi:hypothetical protein
VYAKSIASPNTIYRTTTLSDGSYRFKPFPGGVYDIMAYLGGSKAKRVQVVNGCDTPGVDFFMGAADVKATPPVIQRFSLTGHTGSTLDFDQWAIDPDTEIDATTVQIGSTAGAANLLPSQVIVPGSTKVHLKGLRLPPNYYVTFTYTNGAGKVSKAVHAVQPAAATAFVSDSSGSGKTDPGKVQVRNSTTSGNEIAFVQIDVSALRGKVSDFRISLTGSAKGKPVSVGAFATNNASWTEGSLSWSNAPAILGSAVDIQSVGAVAQYTWNVAPLIQAARQAGTKLITVAIKCITESKDGAVFQSAKATSGTPSVTSTSND